MERSWERDCTISRLCSSRFLPVALLLVPRLLPCACAFQCSLRGFLSPEASRAHDILNRSSHRSSRHRMPITRSRHASGSTSVFSKSPSNSEPPGSERLPDRSRKKTLEDPPPAPERKAEAPARSSRARGDRHGPTPNGTVASTRKRRNVQGLGAVSGGGADPPEAPAAVGKAKKTRMTEPTSQAIQGSSKKKSAGPLPTRDLEFALWDQGFASVAGVDEAGRGPLAGPVVAAACILPKDAAVDLLTDINDSKEVPEEQRDLIFQRLVSHPDVRYAVSIQSHEVIDSVNILQVCVSLCVYIRVRV